MKQPTLIVEGKAIEVYAIFYRDNKIHSVTVIDDNGVTKKYHDVKENTQYYVEKPLQLDFDTCLKWVGQYDEVFKSIGELIAHNQKEAKVLGIEIADEVELMPFAVNEKVQRRKELKQRVFGLMDAQDIVSEFMVEDVDLSGGEEVE